ncbi:uncharacterized protein LOC111299102 [Durio zibethinus]|uniref:Uncharacterized protein LOC111299102 n=1 Tax=Durio zibethinus TaxID=66656 RepID=A0A6P5ZBQ9_DURZI|nr:uncharacterized protein LOC111299102 [Durio zibethinus]
MGATLVMVVSIAIVLGLILVLLAELYCSLLLRRRQLKESTSGSTVSNTATAAVAATTPTNATSSFPPQDNHQDQSTSSLSSFYAHGVLHAPRNFLFPAVLPCKQKRLENENHLTYLHQVLEVHVHESNTSPHQIGILSPTSPSTSFATSPNPVQEISVQVGTRSTNTCSGPCVENFVYISNPIYDNDAGSPDTQFETPDTSPSRLESSGSSGDDDGKAQPCQSHVRHYSPPMTPPLSPMKKLPAQACSVSLRDARSLGTLGSDSNSKNGPSSSSSGSPFTSPSW